MAVLAGGSAAAQALVLLAMPAITALYAADQFGALALFVSSLTILIRVAACGYDMAIPLPRETLTAANLLVLSLALLLALTGLCALLTWALADAIVAGIGSEALRPHLRLVPIGLLAGGAFPALNYWAIRHGAFPDMARARIGQALGTVMAQIVAGLAGAGTVGLLAGDITGRAMASGRLVLRPLRGKSLAGVSVRGLLHAAARYRRVALFSAWGSLLNAASASVPSLLFAPFYGLEVTGWLALTHRVLGAPTEIIAQSVSQIYFREAAGAAHVDPAPLRALYVRLSWTMAAIGLVPVIALGAFGPALFALVFGPAWTDSGTYARVLSATLLARCVIGPLGARTLQVLERQDLLLAWEAVRALLAVASIVLAWSADASALGAVMAYAAATLAAYLALCIAAFRALPRGTRHRS